MVVALAPAIVRRRDAVGGRSTTVDFCRKIAVLVGTAHRTDRPIARASVRYFASFSDAARENADSRIMAGLHFRFATDPGLRLGDQIAQHALADLLQPGH